MKYFISGVMQGSSTSETTKKTLNDQNYRETLKTILKKYDKSCEIHDPYDKPKEYLKDQEHLFSDNKFITDLFEEILFEMRKCDVIVSYLPQASMGSSIELWEAYKLKKEVYVITEMTQNWVTRICSNQMFESIESFEEFMKNKSKYI